MVTCLILKILSAHQRRHYTKHVNLNLWAWDIYQDTCSFKKEIGSFKYVTLAKFVVIDDNSSEDLTSTNLILAKFVIIDNN